MKGALEALLFAADEPLSTRRLADLLGLPPAAVMSLLQDLEEDLKGEERGIMLERVAGGWRLVTKPQWASILAKLKGPSVLSLSPAALETLAIILYRQPVTRAELEGWRGVSCDGVLRTLVEAGYVREVGRRPTPGKPILYGTSPRLLQDLGIEDLAELPRPDETPPHQLFWKMQSEGT
ncbi:MAG: SMC-Scp complex subunit ScpB [Bacillota bacterium]|nr:SMC-Scp complex subunit ScpB [Bacillota bacterium]